MKTHRISALALLCLHCAAPADPWVGRYSGDAITDTVPCGGGASTPGATTLTVSVERDADGLFVDGRCLIRLDALNASSARVIPTRCAYALDDGTPVSVHIVSGRADLDGDELMLEYSAEAVTTGACVTARTVFVGTRP